MRNKTLLIRRHLIHYWHLSNQTTFHKTLFSHSDDEDWKIEHGKYAPCFGKLSQSTEGFPCLCRRPKHLPARADSNNVVTGLEGAAGICCEIVPKIFRFPREQREAPHGAGHRRTCLLRERERAARAVDRRTHSPLMCASALSCGCYCITIH